MPGESHLLADVHIPSISLTFIATRTSPDSHPNSESSGRRIVAEVMENSSLATSLEKLNLKVDQSPEFVDTDAQIASLVARLQNLPTKPPSLYIDLEGINLSKTRQHFDLTNLRPST